MKVFTNSLDHCPNGHYPSLKGGYRATRWLSLALAVSVLSGCALFGGGSSPIEPEPATQDSGQEFTPLSPDIRDQPGGESTTDSTTGGQLDEEQIDEPGAQVGATDTAVDTSATAPEPETPPANPYLENRPDVPEDAQALFAKGIKALQKGKTKQARKWFSQLTVLHPQLSGPYVNLGLLEKQAGKFDKAEGLFKQAIEVNRNNLDAYNALAVMYREQGRFDEAEKYWLQALEVWPLYAPAHRNIGILYELYRGELAKALGHYKTYQGLLEKPDRRIRAWIVDIERRLPAPADNEPEQSAIDNSKESSKESTEGSSTESAADS